MLLRAQRAKEQLGTWMASQDHTQTRNASGQQSGCLPTKPKTDMFVGEVILHEAS